MHLLSNSTAPISRLQGGKSSVTSTSQNVDRRTNHMTLARQWPTAALVAPNGI